MRTTPPHHHISQKLHETPVALQYGPLTPQPQHSPRHKPPNSRIIRIVLLPQIRARVLEELVGAAHCSKDGDGAAGAGEDAEGADGGFGEGVLDGADEEAGEGGDLEYEVG